MPRDLTLEWQDIESMPPISGESGSAAGGGVPYVDQAHYDLMDMIQRDVSKGTVLHELRPIQKLLSLDDLESCITLENAAFGHPEHRCTREKVRHGLLYQPLVTSLWTMSNLITNPSKFVQVLRSQQMLEVSSNFGSCVPRQCLFIGWFC